MITRDEIKEEVERQLRARDGRRRSRWAITFALVLALFGGRLGWAQQDLGGSHQMSDLFRRFFTWSSTSIIAANGYDISIAAGNTNAFYNLCTTLGTFSAYYAETGIFDSNQASGNIAFRARQNGARFDFGAGANDYCSSDGTTVTFAGDVAVTGLATFNNAGNTTFSGASAQLFFSADNAGNGRFTSNMSAATATSTVGPFKFFPQSALDAADSVLSVGTALNAANVFNVDYSGYVASTTPHTMFVTYVNNTITAVTYGGGTAPAHDFDVNAVRFYIRTAGSGGSTNATIRITDGATNCDCAFACNTAAGPQRIACSSAANCDFEASDTMTVSVSGVGDCTSTTDIQGNIEFETIWEI